LFLEDVKPVDVSATLEAVSWLTPESMITILFDSRLSASKKERNAPISLIAHAIKNSCTLLDEPKSKWPNDRFLSSGNHPWFLIMPISNESAPADLALGNADDNLGALFLEFPVETSFSEGEFAQIDRLCLQAASCLKSAVRKQKLLSTSRELAHAKEQLFTYARTLEQRIRIRTLELLQQTDALRAEVKNRIQAQQLSVTLQERAEGALRVKDQFLATMSHELRTPFNGVMGMIQLLEDTELTPKQSEYLSILNNASTNLLNLLNDILDYTKIESGHLEFEYSSFSIRDVCESVINELFDRADDQSIDLTYISKNEETDWIFADPLRLRQLIRCYVDNAVKFNQNRGGYILLTSSMTLISKGGNGERPKYGLSISCADTGPGISDVSTLFVPFSQSDTSNARRYGGTGLSLAICKRLVELLHGDTWCQSTVGQGSTFHFTMVWDCVSLQLIF
jgi:signal transduction histidine kinase